MLPNPSSDLIAIGFIRKAHGLRGEVKVQAKDAFVEDLLKAKVVFLQSKNGPLPYFLSSIRDAHELIAKFEGVDTPEAAKALYGMEVMMRREEIIHAAEEDETDQAPFEALVGYTLYDVSQGLIGPIEEILEMPQQLMAFVRYAEKEVMVPLHPHFVKAIDHRNKRIKMELPEGLLGL